MPKIGIHGVNNLQIMHVAWVRALNWYQRKQSPRLRALGENKAILSKSGKMTHAEIVDNHWMLISNPWFKAGIPCDILSRVVQFITTRTKQKNRSIVREQAISFYRQVYLATRQPSEQVA